MKRKKPRLLLDCDGVIIDFATGLLNTLRRATNGVVDLSVQDFPSWDMYGRLEELEKERRWKGFRNIRQLATYLSREVGFCESLPVFHAAKEGLPKIIEAHNQEKLELFIVTAPFTTNRTWVYERNMRLKEVFGLDAKRIVHTDTKYIVAGDILVDDKDSHCLEWKKHHPGEAFLWTTPHNRNDGKGLKRLSSWSELHEILRIT